MKIISVVGRKDSGKTSLSIRIIQELKSRGYTVSSIKHSHHHLNMDKENTDTWRHKQAGSNTVIGIGDTTHFNISKDLNLDRLLFLIKVINPVDFVVIEGFKSYNYPKIATTEDVVDDKTISLVNSFEITEEKINELVDKIEIHTHDITDTLYADNCGFNDPKKISDEIIKGNLTTKNIDQVDTYLSIDEKVIGLNKFVNNYIKETTIGIIKSLNIKQFNVNEIKNVQLLINEKDTTKRRFEVKNKNIELYINRKTIGLNKFTAQFIINTLFSICNALKTNVKTINTFKLKITQEKTSLNINDINIEINEFVINMLNETIHGMLKSLKTKKYDINHIEDIEIIIN